MAPLRRRGLLAGITAGTAGSALAAAQAAPTPRAAPSEGAVATPSDPARPADDMIDLSAEYPFYGRGPQAGVATPPQRHIMFMTFDVTTTERAGLQMLLARWSGAIAQLMKGDAVGQVEPRSANAVGFDTGEALNLGPAALTVTVGLGPRLFGPEFGLAAQRPPLLRELVELPGQSLRPELTGGDLSLQACADDPQVAYHAIRVLARIAKMTGTAATRWTVLGFGRASAGKGQTTPRNLFGFKDGTRNLREPADMERFVWVKDGPDWQRQGTYQVVRKIRMHIENWDTDRVGDQNRVFGRHKQSGAPLTGRGEFDPPDFAARDGAGNPVIDPAAHIRLASPEENGGLRILRRSYNYTDGLNQYGLLDAGLLFIAYVNDPAHFETLQARLGAADALNEYIQHIGSAIFFVPPAPPEGSYIGQALFAES